MERNGLAIYWNISWANSERLAYLDDVMWVGISLHPPTHVRVCVPRVMLAGMMVGMQQAMQNWLGGTDVSGNKGE